jgi:putative membrane protein
MGWWMLFGGFLWIVFWATVIYVAVTLIRGPRAATRDKQDDPIDIAKRRYAGGEINRDEYEQIRHDLAA